MEIFKCILLIAGLVGYAAAQGCAHCFRHHPQQVFCKSDFVIHGRNTSVETNVAVPESTSFSFNLVTVNLFADLKSSLPEGTEFVEFFSPTSICGTYFVSGGDYVIAGSFEKTSENVTYLLHGHCDYAHGWSQLSDKQRKGFETKYKRLCDDDCEIQGVKAETKLLVSNLQGGPSYEGAHTYWTPYRNCYYNPLRTERLGRKDCEDEYGFCKRNANGGCSWQMTTDYVDCFQKREQYVMALEGSPAITDAEQCNILHNRRQRRKCRQKVRQRQAAAQAEVEVPLELNEGV